MSDEDIYVGSYRLVAQLGSGAFGSVYLAQHAILTNRIVAIKIMHPEHLGSSQELLRFFTEAQILDKLKHPGILPIITVDIGEYGPYLVTEYASKGSLRNRLQKQSSKPMPIEEAIRILSQIGQALQHAHEQNIIHRDLKPENILFNDKGEALLADFGVAAIVGTVSLKQTTTAGTLAYMAPEQFQDMVCKESDQYALGCIAYELFTGHMPFVASNPATLIAKRLMEQPVAPRQYNPQLPTHIEQAILKALAKQRTDRYPNVSSFITALSTPTSGLSREAKELWMAELLAITMMYPGNKGKIIDFCEGAIQVDPNFALAYFTKGVALNDLKRYAEALDAFERVIPVSYYHLRAYVPPEHLVCCLLL